jgi:hypothetical protein
MLVSVSSFLPIIIVGPISDVFGTTAVILGVAALIGASGVASVVTRGPLLPSERRTKADATLLGVGLELGEPPAALPRPQRSGRRAGYDAVVGGPTLWDAARPPRPDDTDEPSDPTGGSSSGR